MQLPVAMPSDVENRMWQPVGQELSEQYLNNQELIPQELIPQELIRPDDDLLQEQLEELARWQKKRATVRKTSAPLSPVDLLAAELAKLKALEKSESKRSSQKEEVKELNIKKSSDKRGGKKTIIKEDLLSQNKRGQPEKMLM